MKLLWLAKNNAFILKAMQASMSRWGEILWMSYRPMPGWSLSSWAKLRSA